MMRIARSALAGAVLMSACVGELGSGPAGPGGREGPVPPAPTGSAIRLNPPAGTGERALRCEPDHAPLRRLNHREYAHTMRDLFAGLELPELVIAPDERRRGFTNNYETLAPSPLLVTQYFEQAQRIASATAAPIVAGLECAPDEACFRAFVTDFGARAYRRPLTDAEIDEHVAVYASGPLAGDFDAAIETVIATFLQSPATLYRPELGSADGTLTQHEIASRLSYFVWGSMPDDALFDAASRGSLHGDALRAEVGRLLADPRAREGLVAATVDWLELERLATRLKADEYAFTPEVREHLRLSIERFLWDRVLSEEGSIDALYTSPGAYVDSTIGPIFGIDDAGDELAWRELPHRAGIVTHPAILATHGHGEYGSPVLRGVFVLTELLCDPPSPPPADIPMTAPPRTDDSGTALTNREGYAILTQSGPACAACHNEINPFGFALEGFDTVGALREEDQGRAVDTTGESRGFSLGETFSFDGAVELAQQLQESERARACIVDRWVRYAAGGGPLAYDPCFRRELEQVASRPGASLRDLVIAIALDPRFVAAEVVE